MNETHNDGMSSDDEVPDIEYNQYKEQICKYWLHLSVLNLITIKIILLQHK